MPTKQARYLEQKLRLIEPSVNDVSTTPPQFHMAIRTVQIAYRQDGNQLTGFAGRQVQRI